MAETYRDLLRQLESVTWFDGFISTLIDIRDSMLFYDRDLMLAGYTGTVEALAVSALAAACLESDGAAEEAFAEVRRLVDELPSRLASADAPVDVQTVVEAFLRVGAWVLRERVSVFLLAFGRYLHDDYDANGSVDELVLQAHERIESDPEDALDRVGEVGALMLRGHLLRPRWLFVSPPRLSLWLAGLRNMAGHLAATYGSFPWAAIEEQRRRPAPAVVVDLQSFRRRRLAAMDAWRLFDLGQPHDEADRLLERILGGHSYDPDTLSAISRLAEQVGPLLVAAVRARHLADPHSGDPGAVVAAIRALTHLRRHEIVPRLIELATDPDVEGDLAKEARESLEALGGLALEGVADYLRRTEAPQGGPVLARLLARLPRSEKTFRALVDLFERVRWEDGKSAVARALAEYGDGRAVAVLERALNDPQLPAGHERRELEGALRRLSGRAARRRRVAKG